MSRLRTWLRPLKHLLAWVLNATTRLRQRRPKALPRPTAARRSCRLGVTALDERLMPGDAVGGFAGAALGLLPPHRDQLAEVASWGAGTLRLDDESPALALGSPTHPTEGPDFAARVLTDGQLPYLAS